MLCVHDRYNLGDEEGLTEDDVFEQILDDCDINYVYEDELDEDLDLSDYSDDTVIIPFDKDTYDTAMKAIREKAYIENLSLYDHSGLTISIGSAGGGADSWDTSNIGFIYITKEKMKSEFPNLNEKELEEKANSIIESDVKIYDEYLQGNVFGIHTKTSVSIENKDSNLPILCSDVKIGDDYVFGFYGDNINENGMLDYLPREDPSIREQFGNFINVGDTAYTSQKIQFSDLDDFLKKNIVTSINSAISAENDAVNDIAFRNKLKAQEMEANTKNTNSIKP